MKLAFLIPWHKVEEHYARCFSPMPMVRRWTMSVHGALEALITQQKLNTSSEETEVQITEKPYLQYLIGLEVFRQEQLFDSALMPHFHKRLGPEVLSQVNKWIIMATPEQEAEGTDEGLGNTVSASGHSL